MRCLLLTVLLFTIRTSFADDREAEAVEEATARALGPRLWAQLNEVRSQDPDPAVRVRAVRALDAATHRVSDPWLERYTLRILRDDDAAVRTSGLLLARNLPPRTLGRTAFRAALAERLRDDSADVVARAVRVAGRLSREAHASEELRPALMHALDGPHFVEIASMLLEKELGHEVRDRLLLVARDPERRQDVYDVANRIGNHHSGVFRLALNVQSWHEQPDSREYLEREMVWQLRRIDRVPRWLLASMLEIGDDGVRTALLETLESGDLPEDVVEELLVDSLTSDNAAVRRAANAAIVSRERRVDLLREALRRAEAEEPSPALAADLREWTVDALLDSSPADGFEADVEALTRHEREDVRLRAWLVLPRFTNEHESMVAGLAELLSADDPAVRARAALELGKLRRLAIPVFPKLLPLLNDDDDRVSAAAVTAIQSLDAYLPRDQ